VSALKYRLAVSAPAISRAVSTVESSERQTRAPVSGSRKWY
jgi:hypothetical protein